MLEPILLLGDKNSLKDNEKKLIREITGSIIETPDMNSISLKALKTINTSAIIFSVQENLPPAVIELMDNIVSTTKIPVIIISSDCSDEILCLIQRINPDRFFIRPFSEMQIACSIKLLTGEIRQEKKYRQPANCYYTIFEQMKNPIFICDSSGIIQQANHALELLLNTERSDMIGQPVKKYINDNKNYNKIITSVKTGGHCHDYPIVISKKNDEGIKCTITASELFNRECSYSGYYAVINNIDSEKQAELDKDLLIEKLGESVLKLRCLYSLSEMMMEPEIEIDDILKGITDRIIYSTHNPDRLGVKITYFDREFYSENYRSTDLKIQSDIRVNNETAGVIELSYMHDKPQVRKSLSFREDKNLIKAIAERIGAVAERIETLKELERTNNELRSMSDYLRTVREEERKNISREIHDELGQALTGIRMGIVWLILKLDESREVREKKLASMLRIVEGTIDAVRKIASELRPGILDNLGLVSAIEWLADEIKNRSSIKCIVSVEPDEISVPENLKVNIFRIIQEATTNTIRYAKAKKITVSLEQTETTIDIMICDDGCGIPPDAISDSYSYGIIGMRERAKSMNGTFSIKGIPEKGTRIEIRVPFESENSEKDLYND